MSHSDGTVRIEPSGNVATAWFAAALCAGVAVFACAYPGVPFAIRVLFAYGALLIGGAIVAFFGWLHTYERKRGSYLVMSKTAIRVRGHEIISFDEFKSFEVRAKQEKLADGWQWVYSLVLLCNSQKEIEIVACVIEREIVKLKRTLDERLANPNLKGTREN